MTNPLYDALFGAHAGRDAVFLYPVDAALITYSEFLKHTARCANALTKMGAKVGDRVAVQVEKSVDVLAVYAACVQAGFVFLPLNPAYTPAEISYFVGDARAAILIGKPDHTLHDVAATHGAQLLTIGVAGEGRFLDLAAAQSDHFETVPRNADDLAAILYTSGTTGRSKGAMLSQANLLSNAQVLTDLWQFTHRDVLLHALPVFHTHGLFVATNVTLLAGGAMVFLPKFDVPILLDHMPKATALMGVPTFYTRLLETPAFTYDAAAHMRVFISGSAPLLTETHRSFTALTGHHILERYGMTETNMSTSNPYTGDRRAGTVGLTLPGVVAKVCDANGVEVSRGEVGVLEVRGDNVFQGYWNMPEKTAAELRANGFFITGDLAVMDADGYVTIVGRSKDLIIAGGLNIYPKEVEEVIDAVAGVLESAVIGVPHPDLGEAAIAVIVLNDANLDLMTVAQVLQAKLARFKHPRHMVVVDALPRNTMGKVQKAALRETYRAQFLIT